MLSVAELARQRVGRSPGLNVRMACAMVHSTRCRSPFHTGWAVHTAAAPCFAPVGPSSWGSAPPSGAWGCPCTFPPCCTAPRAQSSAAARCAGARGRRGTRRRRPAGCREGVGPGQVGTSEGSVLSLRRRDSQLRTGQVPARLPARPPACLPACLPACPPARLPSSPCGGCRGPAAAGKTRAGRGPETRAPA